MAVDTKGKDALQENKNLMRALDRGIDDMEAERELPLDEAFHKNTIITNTMEVLAW